MSGKARRKAVRYYISFLKKGSMFRDARQMGKVKKALSRMRLHPAVKLAREIWKREREISENAN